MDLHQELTTFYILRAHCKEGDKECIAAHLKYGKGVLLPTKKLLLKLEGGLDLEKRIDKLLEKLNVPTINVTYEGLYFGEDASEWMRIFRFLGVGPSQNLTPQDVEEAGQFVSTSVSYHNVTLGNYEEVRSTLNGTKFASLLH